MNRRRGLIALSCSKSGFQTPLNDRDTAGKSGPPAPRKTRPTKTTEWGPKVGSRIPLFAYISYCGMIFGPKNAPRKWAQILCELDPKNGLNTPRKETIRNAILLPHGHFGNIQGFTGNCRMPSNLADTTLWPSLNTGH